MTSKPTAEQLARMRRTATENDWDECWIALIDAYEATQRPGEPIAGAAARAMAEEVLKLGAAATPGEWTLRDGKLDGGAVYAPTPGVGEHPRQVAMATGQAAYYDERANAGEVLRANAALIARYRTLAPQLATAAIALSDELEALYRAIGRPVGDDNGRPCIEDFDDYDAVLALVLKREQALSAADVAAQIASMHAEGDHSCCAHEESGGVCED